MAAASLAPSPTIAVRTPAFSSEWTTWILFSGVIRAKMDPLGDDALLVLAGQRIPFGAGDHLPGAHRHASSSAIAFAVIG